MNALIALNRNNAIVNIQNSGQRQDTVVTQLNLIAQMKNCLCFVNRKRVSSIVLYSLLRLQINFIELCVQNWKNAMHGLKKES